jgi:hypothetical protein
LQFSRRVQAGGEAVIRTQVFQSRGSRDQLQIGCRDKQLVFPGLIKNFIPVQGINFDPVVLLLQAGMIQYFLDRLMELANFIFGWLSLRWGNEKEKRRDD